MTRKQLLQEMSQDHMDLNIAVQRMQSTLTSGVYGQRGRPRKRTAPRLVDEDLLEAIELE